MHGLKDRQWRTTRRTPPRALPLALSLLSLGCGRYADFTLPPPEGDFAPVELHWQTLPEPVLGPGEPGAWDSIDVLNPSLVRQDGSWLNFYSGFDGTTWHTGLAISADGKSWDKRGRLLSPDPDTWEGGYIAANGAAIDLNGQVFYWYQAGDPPRIGLARMINGSFVKEPDPVVPLGPNGSWDERGVADPYVIRAGNWLFMFYLGQDRARRQRLGVARSRDGVKWEKLRSNPILEHGDIGAFDENGLGEPAVWASGGRYWMLYTGRDRVEHRRLGLAWSRDGVRWERYAESAVLAGERDWNSKVVCDPHVEADHDRFLVWFGGGNVAHPAENINGRIGLAILRIEPR